MPIQTSVTLIPGDTADIPLRCFDRAGNQQQFLASDSISAGVRLVQASSDLFAPTVGWNTRGGLQTGNDQGEVMVTLTSAQTQTLQPGRTYNLTVRRVLGADNTKSESIARCQINIEAIA